MLYKTLRWISGILLHWFYSEIRVEGAEGIPSGGPMLIAVNHPNAMVDSLIAGWIVPRRMRMTAKATLMGNPFVAIVFRMIGVVPLRRASDEPANTVEPQARNENAFAEIIAALRAKGCVLIFPEGRSNSDSLTPLKTGLARIALEARRTGVSGLWILPIGLNFENKGAPGSRVVVKIGPALAIDEWKGDSPRELTAEISSRLSVISGHGAFPPVSDAAPAARRGFLVRLASWWGRTTHEIPVRYARQLAVSRSTDADEPAMLTMLFGVALVIASYALHLAVVGFLTRSFLFSFAYLAALIAGAYWTAFEGHRR
jgi:1-acyl-sn-glycerol-3-phosphate acyltransferase